MPSNTQRDLGTVIDVIDGDTIDVRIAGLVYRVRYIGMDTPEEAYLSNEATAVNRNLVNGQEVLLIKDVSDVDQFGRLLRYVFSGEIFVNFELVNRGYAQILTYPPDVACSDTFLTAQQLAISSFLGFWQPTRTPANTQIPVYPTSTPQQNTSGNSGGEGNCHPSYPTVCIAPPPPDLDCGDIPYRRFTVVGADPHRFDGDNDSVGCES